MLSTVHNALSESCMFNLYQSGDVDIYFVIVFLDLAVHNFLIVYGKRYKCTIMVDSVTLLNCTFYVLFPITISPVGNP